MRSDLSCSDIMVSSSLSCVVQCCSVLVTFVCLVDRCAACGLVLTRRLYGLDGGFQCNCVRRLVVTLPLKETWHSKSRVAHGSMTRLGCFGSAAEAAKLRGTSQGKTKGVRDSGGGNEGEDQCTEERDKQHNIPHNLSCRWQKNGVGPKQNPCHQQLNNSSCISVSQGILSRECLIGQTATRAMRTPVSML
jgi:hypothetical protein